MSVISRFRAWFDSKTQFVMLPPETSLLSMPEFVPEEFSFGIEVLNDARTPMQFVIDVFQEHFEMDEETATRTMLDVHTKGGVILGCNSLEEATRITNSIARDASALGHPLICRPVCS